MALIAIEASEAQLRMIMSDDNYRRLIRKHPASVIILCQNNSVRVLHDAVGMGSLLNTPTFVPEKETYNEEGTIPLLPSKGN